MKMVCEVWLNECVECRSDVVVHKTFHRYTVRAKKGTVQSVRDNQSGGHGPKSVQNKILFKTLQEIHSLRQQTFVPCFL